jgi:hypothetical protein
MLKKQLDLIVDDLKRTKNALQRHDWRAIVMKYGVPPTLTY